jgi:hypothetical protein
MAMLVDEFAGHHRADQHDLGFAFAALVAGHGAAGAARMAAVAGPRGLAPLRALLVRLRDDRAHAGHRLIAAATAIAWTDDDRSWALCADLLDAMLAELEALAPATRRTRARHSRPTRSAAVRAWRVLADEFSLRYNPELDELDLAPAALAERGAMSGAGMAEAVGADAVVLIDLVRELRETRWHPLHYQLGEVSLFCWADDDAWFASFQGLADAIIAALIAYAPAAP